MKCIETKLVSLTNIYIIYNINNNIRFLRRKLPCETEFTVYQSVKKVIEVNQC